VFGEGNTAAPGGRFVNNIIYIVGLVVIVLAILAFLGLR
jgi:small-conductance mechanosensitive channel